MREIATSAGLPEPDEVEYRDDEIVLLWREAKLAVVVELDGNVASSTRSTIEQYEDHL